jgi:hypothetical protein
LQLNESTSRLSTRMYKNEQRTSRPFRRICPGRRDRAISAGLGGSDDIRHLAVLLVFTSRNGSAPHSMVQKVILRRLPAGFYVLPLFAFLLGLARHSYRAKELLVCWLFFCSFFALLALMFLGAVLACYAGRRLVKWVRAANTVVPELAVWLAESPQETSSGPRILVSGTLKLSAGSRIPEDVLDPASWLLIEVMPSAAGV